MDKPKKSFHSKGKKLVIESQSTLAVDEYNAESDEEKRTKIGGNAEPAAPDDSESNKRSLEPKKFGDIELDNSEENMLPITFHEFFEYTNIENIVQNEIKKSRRNSYAEYINDEAYVQKLARRSYLHFYTNPKHRKSEPFKYIKLCSKCPARVKDRFMDIPEQYQRKRKGNENEFNAKKPTDIKTCASKDKNCNDVEDDLRSPKPSTIKSQKSEQNKSNASKGKHSNEMEEDLCSPNPSHSQKSEQNNIICPPPSFKVFKRFVNFEAEIEKRISACANKEASCDKNLRSKFERDFYNDFYDTPTLRHNLLWTLRPCPRKTKVQILTHVPRIVESNILNENVIPKGKLLEPSEEASQLNTIQPGLVLEEEKGFEYPISYEIFKKYTYCDKIVDAIFKENYGNDTVALAEAQSDHRLRDKTFKNYYHGFYKDISIRKKYKIKLRPCPAHIKDRIMQMPAEKDENILNTKDNSETSRKRRSDNMEILQLSPNAKKPKILSSSAHTDLPSSTTDTQSSPKTLKERKNIDSETPSNETTNKSKTVHSPKAIDLFLPTPSNDIESQKRESSQAHSLHQSNENSKNKLIAPCYLQGKTSKTVLSSNNIDKPPPIKESENSREKSNFSNQMNRPPPINEIPERKSLDFLKTVDTKISQNIGKSSISPISIGRTTPTKETSIQVQTLHLPTHIVRSSPTSKNITPKPMTSGFKKTVDLPIPILTTAARNQSNLSNSPKTDFLPTVETSTKNPNQAISTDNSSSNKPVKIVSWWNAKVLMDYIAKKANNLDRKTQISILKKTKDKALKPGYFSADESVFEEHLPVRKKQFIEVQSVEIFFPIVNANNEKQQGESSTSEKELAKSSTEEKESSHENFNNSSIADAVELNKSYPDTQFSIKKTPLLSPNILLSSSGSTALTQSQSLQSASKTLTAMEDDPNVAIQSTPSCLSSICSQQEFFASMTSTQKQPEDGLPNLTFSKDPLKQIGSFENQKNLGDSELENVENYLHLNDHDVKKEPKFLDHLQFILDDSNSEIHVRSFDTSQPIIIEDTSDSDKGTTTSNLVDVFMNANNEPMFSRLQLSGLHSSQSNDENTACTFHEAQRMPSSLEESNLDSQTPQSVPELVSKSSNISMYCSRGVEVLKKLSTDERRIEEDHNYSARMDSVRVQSANKKPNEEPMSALPRPAEVKTKTTASKSNRQIDSVPQLTHAFRSLPLTVNKIKPNDQSTPCSGTASSFSASQALAADCTLFKSSQLLNIIEKEQSSDTDAIVAKPTTPSLQQQQEEIQSDSVPRN